MRHFALLFIFSLICYFGWFYARARQRNEVRGFLAAHVVKILVILVVLQLALVAQFYLNSTKLL